MYVILSIQKKLTEIDNAFKLIMYNVPKNLASQTYCNGMLKFVWGSKESVPFLLLKFSVNMRVLFMVDR